MKKYLNVRGKLLDCSVPLVMGILNLTPDSFYDGGNSKTEDEILSHVREMVDEGASIIDLGAQSTRPGATLLTAKEEWDRMHKPLKSLRRVYPAMIFSADTFYAEVAELAADEGIDIINDVSGGMMDESMFETIGKLRIPYVLTHMQGTPGTMQQHPQYANVTAEVMNFFSVRISQLLELGVTDIIIDPGFGFGKTLEHNFELLSRLDLLTIFERPMLAGLSRKSMVNKVTGSSPENALNGTTILNTIALEKGANILRVHDVKEAIEAIKLTEKILNSK